MPAEAIPLADGAVEVVVSFETIEHVPSPAGFVRECRRVLAPGGLLVLSTPNRDEYSANGHHNEFHVAEMNEAEFRDVLAPHFTPLGWYRQRPTIGSWWRPLRVWADHSPWVSNGVGRGVRRALRGAFCPHILRPPTGAVRSAPVDLIHAADRPLSRWVNPYAVQPRQPGEGDRPSYYLVVARRAD
jgi:SAM-dependent methyltransferase